MRTIKAGGNQNNPLFPEKLSFPRLIPAAVFSASYIPKTHNYHHNQKHQYKYTNNGLN